VTAILLATLDFFQLSRSRHRQDKRRLERGFHATVVAVALIVVSYALFVNMFLYDDFALIEAYSYSSSGLSSLSKLHATWAGAGGSLLLLSLIIALVYFVFRFRTYENPSLHGISVNRILIGILIFFLVMTVIKNPFARFDRVVLEGRGLHPSLQSIWMTIHPPIVFMGYAFILLAVALAFSRIIVKGKNDDGLLDFSLQIAWFFLTLGIALGGFWAYTVIGWGGYWYWDPVETASLMTWLMLTAYFHFRPFARTGKGLSKEFVILLVFEALIFLSALTRGGFRQSVHEYALSPAGPILLLFGFTMAAYFLHLKRKSGLPICSIEVNKFSLRSVSLLLGFASLIAIFTVCSIGVIFPIVAEAFVGSSIIFGVDFYNVLSFPFISVILVSLIGYNVPGEFGFKKFAVLIGGLIIIGFLFAVMGFPTRNGLANVGLPLLSLSLLSSTYGMIRTLGLKSKNFRLFGRKIIHFGVIITLIGVFVSAGARQSSVFADVATNTTLETFELSVKIGNFTVYNGTGRVYASQIDSVAPDYTSLRLDVEILQYGKTYKGVIWTYLYINYGFISNPLVIATERGDIYLHLDITQSMKDALTQSFTGKLVIPGDLIITVEKVPLVYLVWMGIALLCIGIVLSFGRLAKNNGSCEREDAKLTSKNYTETYMMKITLYLSMAIEGFIRVS